MKSLDTGLNLAIIHIASRIFPAGFDVSGDAPHSFDQLKTQLDAGKRMVVFSGGSDATVYADPEVNWCFRAWHDWCHWRGNHTFSLAGETAVFRMQAEHLIGLYGDGPDVQRWVQIIHAEIVGQAEFYELHGHFPEDQYAFVVVYLAAAERKPANAGQANLSESRLLLPNSAELIGPSLPNKTTSPGPAKAR